MAIGTITTGGAHSSENGSKFGTAGDQLQKQSPDLKTGSYSGGEVCMKDYATEAAFARRFAGYVIIRPKSATSAAAMASCMITACNNPNVGYSQSHDSNGREGIKKYKVTSKVPTNCDCSSLVSECVNEGAGANIIMCTTQSLAGALKKTGLFYDPVPFKSYKATPPYNGDIMLKSGVHTEMVVRGHPREGTSDEILITEQGAAGVYSLQDATLSSPVQYNFVARTEEPKESDEGWSFYSGDDYKINQNGKYAWGRFSEILGSKCALSRGMAKEWYDHKEDKYQRGMAPSLGAVMCYADAYNPNNPGMVSIVEDIGSDYIMVSQRSVKGGKFEYVKRMQKNKSWNLDLDGDGKAEMIFQGFIYNPGVSVDAESSSTKTIFSTFIANAEAQVGKDGSLTKKLTGVNTKSAAWSGAFILAMAMKTGGMVGKLLPETTSCSAIGSLGVEGSMGTWIDGPALGGQPLPQLGDIAFFRTTTVERTSKYECDKAGIITDLNTDSATTQGNNTVAKYKFSVVVGDCQGQVTKTTYTNLSKTLSGLFRPDWDKVDGTAKIIQFVYSDIGMYTEGTTSDHAFLRDFTYLKSTSSGGFQPSISKTNLTLSAINYTGLLSNLYSVVTEVSLQAASNQGVISNLWNNTAMSKYQIDVSAYQPTSDSTTSDTDVTTVTDYLSGISVKGGSVTVRSSYYGRTVTATMTRTATADEIYNILYAKLKNKAGVIGVMGNMFQESRWNPGAVNKSDGGSGLIQWTDTRSKYGVSLRCTNMKKWCRSKGNHKEFAQNLLGQLSFLFHEIATTRQYKTGWDKIKQVSETQEGAVAASTLFLDYFEIGMGNIGKEIERQNIILRSGWTRGAWTLFFGGKK